MVSEVHSNMTIELLHRVHHSKAKSRGPLEHIYNRTPPQSLPLRGKVSLNQQLVYLCPVNDIIQPLLTPKVTKDVYSELNRWFPLVYDLFKDIIRPQLTPNVTAPL